MGLRRALLLCPEAPYPMHGGGAMRTASTLNYLNRNFQVDLALFQEEGAECPASHIPNGLSCRTTVLTLPRHSRSAPARALRNLNRLFRGVVPLCDRFHGRQSELSAWLDGQEYDLAVLEHFWLAPYESAIRRHARHVVLDLHNVESVLLSRTAAQSRGASLALRRFASIAEEAERELLPRFDGLWVTSDSDAAQVRTSGVPVTVYPNSLPAAPPPDVDKQDIIAFSANWAYPPNQSGLRWFLGRVWPGLRRRHPNLELLLIGRNPELIRPLLAIAEGVQCTGGVPEALPWIARARVAIAPLLAGSGTRLKIVEAWAAKAPVVATSIGAEGLTATAGTDLLIEDSPEGFAAAVSRLLESPEVANRIAEAGRSRFESSYSWPAAWETLARAGF